MCGIAGYSRAAGKSSIPNGIKFAHALAVAIEHRGRHATGFGWTGRDGWPWYWKERGAAGNVMHHAPLETGMRTLIAHTRHATTGSPKQHENNHPVTAPGIVLVHNGRVDNHNDIFDALDCDRVGAVDSEAIAALLAHGFDQFGNTGIDHVTDLLEMVEGVAAVAWLDGNEPDVLHLARLSTRPLAIGWTKRGDLVFSSTPATLRAASTLANVTIKRIEEIKEGEYLRVEAGVIVERRSFYVETPVVVVPEDVPGAHRVYDPSEFDWDDAEAWATVTPKKQQTAANEIDWSNLVPRRGWVNDPDLTRPTGKHRWSTARQSWVLDDEGAMG